MMGGSEICFLCGVMVIVVTSVDLVSEVKGTSSLPISCDENLFF